MRRALIACALVAIVLAVTAAPAEAHPATVQFAVDYRTRVTAVTPAVAGVDVRFVADGSRLELRNHTGRTVEVVGYQGEPWLQVRADGVWLNTRSPSHYLDLPDSPRKAAADPNATPQWERTSGDSYARWHDHRTVWHGTEPPQVRADPSRAHRVRDWTVPLRTADGTVQIAGTLDWLPPPNAGTWWALVLIAAAAIAVVGTRPARATRYALAGVALLTGLTTATAAIALVATNATPTAGGWATALVSEAIPILGGLAMAATAVAAIARHAVTDLGFLVTGLTVAVFAGAVDVPIFSHPVPPIPVDGVWSRLAETVALAGGIGLAVVGLARMFRRTERPAPVG